jgi:phospholipid-binding lipoprotein MlaA
MFYLYFFKIKKYFIIFLFFAFFLTLKCEAYKFYNDPIENFNKKSYVFNKKLDKFILKPITIVYLDLMPRFFVKHIGNIVQNYSELPNITHDIFQMNVINFFNNSMRFFINSFFGIYGIFDIANKLKFKANSENYGKSLKCLGYDRSIYLVLPILGSCTIRDMVSLLINNDFIVNKFYLDKYIKYYYIFYILYSRILLLRSEMIFFQAGVDEYVLLKNIYLQHVLYQHNK